MLALIATVLVWALQQQLEHNALEQQANEVAVVFDGTMARYLKPTDMSVAAGKARRSHWKWLAGALLMADRHLVGVKVWDRHGRVIYSNDPRQIGARYAIDANLRTALSGHRAMGVSNLNEMKTALERQGDSSLLDTYVPIYGWGKVIGAYEAFSDLGALQLQMDDARRTIWLSVGLGFLVLYASLFAIVRRASRRLVHQMQAITALEVQARESVESPSTCRPLPSKSYAASVPSHSSPRTRTRCTSPTGSPSSMPIPSVSSSFSSTCSRMRQSTRRRGRPSWCRDAWRETALQSASSTMGQASAPSRHLMSSTSSFGSIPAQRAPRKAPDWGWRSPAALDLVELDPPDLVLLDLMMPGIDGFICSEAHDLADAVAHPIGPLFPVFVCTPKEDAKPAHLPVKEKRLGNRPLFHHCTSRWALRLRKELM